jgi:trimeric autotransporter adhesin
MKNSVRLALCALTVLVFGAVSVDAQNISTVAGGGPVGLPAGASLGSPAAVRFNAAGDTFILDNNFGRVLKIDHTTGLMSVYAGNGTVGFSGDGHLATLAQMNGPSGMCLDATGNVYIADSDNAVIRKVTAATGIITTFAGVPNSTNMIFGGDGGAATAADLHFPDGCSFDSAGNMYIADRGNNEIRVIYEGGTVPTGLTGPLTAGNIYKFAGGTDGAPPTPPSNNGGFSADGTLATAAALYGPFDVFVDTSVTPNNVYYTEIGNHYDAHGAPILTAPINNNIVREILGADGTIHTVAGKQGVFGFDASGPAVGAALYEPKGLSVDASGNIFFADQVNQVIRKVSAGTISVIAGQFNQHGYSGDGLPATQATVTFPSGTLINAAGNLYIADQGSNAIREVPNVLSGTSLISTVAGNGKASYGGDNALAANGEINTPAGLSADAAGDIIIADSGSDLIRGIDGSTGKLSTLAGSPESNGFQNVAPSSVNTALGVAIGSGQTVYVADTLNCIVRKISSTGIVTIAGIEPPIVSADNALLNVPVCGFTAPGGAALATKLGFIQSVAVDSHGNVFFSDSTNNAVWEVPVTTSGSLVINNAYIVAGSQTGVAGFSGDGAAANKAQLSSPAGIFIDIYDNLFIADAGNHRIREVPAVNVGSTMTAGFIYTIAGKATSGITGDGGLAIDAELQYPFAIVVDNAENVYFSDTTLTLTPLTGPTSTQTIRKIAGATGDISTVAGVTNTAGFSGDVGSLTPAAATAANLDQPLGLALQPNSDHTTANLLISDSVNNRVRSVASIANAAPVPLASLSPNPVNFSAEPIGTASAAIPVTLSNPGGATLTITGGNAGVTITNTTTADFTQTNNCTTVPAAGTCTINVTFNPLAGPLGARTATLTVADDAFGGTQSITLNGTAGSPAATLNPTSLTFASTVVGVASAAQTVTLTNGGNVATIIMAGGITITGANAGDFTETDNCVGLTGVAPAGTCAIMVTFKPTATGSRTATLNVASNVGGAPATVALTGTAASPVLTLSLKDTDTSSTQTVAAGATATYNLSVTANQAVTATITCTGAPTAAVCTPAPASVAVTAAAPGTLKVTVTTTARGAIMPFDQPSTKMHPPTAMQLVPMASLALLFAIVMMLSWMQNPASRMRTLRVAMSVCLILMPIAAATMLVGCGGSTSTTPPPPPPVTGTPAGTYTIVVTATSGSTTSSANLTLVVN